MHAAELGLDLSAESTVEEVVLIPPPISSSLAVRTARVVPRSRTMGFDDDPGGNTVLFFGSVPAQGSPFDAAYSYFAVIR